ncbi:MAG TPA: GNAT family N-acetyltransferase [Candidatus Hydrogenedentes bacterium]|nr:GNAT family N-acetyltransferase [Candidatus Hydrogenedentota bacterium]
MKELVLRGVETEDELAQANDLMAKAHSRIFNFFDGIHWMETCGAGYPGFQREHTRIGLWNGELAGALRLTTHTIRLGEARLKTGGLGWIATDGRHRHKGVARELMVHTLQFMKSQNYHVTMLFGIPNFYHRFGFATTLAEYSTVVPTEEALVVAPGMVRVRQGKPGDIQAIQKIHYANDADVACSHVRTGAHITNKWERWKPLRVLTDDAGKVMAYFLPQRLEDEILVEDAGVSNSVLCGAIVRACGEYAQEECLAKIRFSGPPSCPMIQYLHRYKSTHEMRITRDQGGMMAFVNLEETLESMVPEWEHLLVRSPARNLQCEATLIVDRAPWRIRVNRGALAIDSSSGSNKVGLSSGDLMNLLTGYRYLEDILAEHRRILTPQARELLGVIFPKRTPYVWNVDRF